MRINDFRGILPQPFHQFGDPLDLRFILQRGKLLVDLLLQSGVAILRKAAFILLQIAVFKMPNLIKAVAEQIPTVGDYQKRSLIGINQVPQTI